MKLPVIKKEEKKKIKEVTNFAWNSINFISKKMRLNGIQVDVVYVPEEMMSSHKGYSIPFAIKHNKVYKHATLSIFPTCIEAYFGEYGKNRLFDGLVHEMCHLLSTHIRELAVSRYATKKEIDDADEEMVESIASLLRPYYNEEFNNLKKQVCEVKKQSSKTLKKQTNKSKAK